MNDRLLNVLLAEDNEDHMELISFSLERSGFCKRIDRFYDGEAALHFLRSEAGSPSTFPGLIMLDLHMPKLGGLGALAAIKADEKLRTIPTVLLTTSSDERDRLAAYRQGANSYLVKPFDYDDFRMMIVDLARYWGRWNRTAAPM